MGMPSSSTRVISPIISQARARAIPIRASLIDALFTLSQQRVLGLLFGQPSRSFFANELIALSAGGTGAIQRELAKLESAGLIVATRMGNQKHFQANDASPIYSELVGIFTKTVGLADPIKYSLTPFAAQIKVAFIYGSVARGEDGAMSDIDVMILSASLSYADVFDALQLAETRIGRTINPTVQTPAIWLKKLSTNNAFAQNITGLPKIFLIGSEADLG